MESVEFLSADLVRLAFVFGMVLSVFLYEKSHLTTGSIVVPGFLGIHFLEPQFIFGLILNSWICFLIVHRFAPRFFLMSARCKFHSLIVTSVLVQIAWSQLAAVEFGFIAVAGSSMSELGYVIPGLIAHDMSRNGAQKTAANTLFVSYLVGAMTFVLISFLPALALTEGDAVAVPARYDLVLVLTLSIFGSLYLKLKTPIRSAGYVTCAYLVFLCNSPTLLMAIFFAVVVTYFVCFGVLTHSMIIFGRRKFAVALIIAAILMWSEICVLKMNGIGLEIFEHSSYAGILLLIPGLIANEMERASVSSVTSGMSLCIAWILIVGGLYHETRSFFRPEQVIPLLAAFAGILVVAGVLSKTSAQHRSPARLQSIRE